MPKTKIDVTPPSKTAPIPKVESNTGTGVVPGSEIQGDESQQGNPAGGGGGGGGSGGGGC